MPHQTAPPSSYHGRNAPPSQSYYTPRGTESIRAYPASQQPARGYRTAQPYNNNSNNSKNKNIGREYYQEYASEPPHYNQSQGSYHAPSTHYRRPQPNTYQQNRAHIQYRTHGRHHPEYREYETAEQMQPPQLGGVQRYNQNINSGNMQRNELIHATPTVVSSSFSHQSVLEQQNPSPDDKEEHNKARVLASTSNDDTHESAEEVAVSALLLSAGGPPRSGSLSRNPSNSEPAEMTTTNSYIQEQRPSGNVVVKMEQNNFFKSNDPQEVLNSQLTAAPQPPDMKIEESATSKGPPSEVNFSHFPSILHKVLTFSNHSGKVLEWLPHGQAWRVLRWDELAKSVLPTYFPNMCLDDEGECGERMNCFLWHVRSWGFQEVKDVGPDMGAYWHNCFIQGDVNMCHQMHPYPPGGFASKGNKKDQTSPKITQPTSSTAHINVLSNSKLHQGSWTNPHFVQRASVNQDAMMNNESKSQSFKTGIEEKHSYSSTPRNETLNNKPSKQLSPALQVPHFGHRDSRYAVELERRRCISQDETSIVSTSPVKRRPPYRQDEDPQNVHHFNPPPNKYYSSEVAHLPRTPSWPTSNKGISPSRKEHYASTRINHYRVPYLPNQLGGLIPESPPYEMPKHMHKDAETRFPETQHISMPYSAVERDTSRLSPNQVSPERAPRETGQRLRSGRGGTRAHVPQGVARLERRDEPEKRTEQLSVPSKTAPNFSVSTRGKGNRVSHCVRQNNPSSHMSEAAYNPNQSVSELGIYGQKRQSSDQGESFSSLPSMPVPVAVSRKTKRHRTDHHP